jgi:hypothetical protein
MQFFYNVFVSKLVWVRIVWIKELKMKYVIKNHLQMTWNNFENVSGCFLWCLWFQYSESRFHFSSLLLLLSFTAKLLWLLTKQVYCDNKISLLDKTKTQFEKIGVRQKIERNKQLRKYREGMTKLRSWLQLSPAQTSFYSNLSSSTCSQFCWLCRHRNSKTSS